MELRHHTKHIEAIFFDSDKPVNGDATAVAETWLVTYEVKSSGGYTPLWNLHRPLNCQHSMEPKEVLNLEKRTISS